VLVPVVAVVSLGYTILLGRRPGSSPAAAAATEKAVSS
jgi:hypothetical protein